MLRLGGRESWVLGGGWIEGVELGDYEAGVVVDVTTDGACWNAAVGDAEKLEIWAWEDDRLDLVGERISLARQRTKRGCLRIQCMGCCALPGTRPGVLRMATGHSDTE